MIKSKGHSHSVWRAKVANATVEHYSLHVYARVCMLVCIYMSILWLLASNCLPTLQPSYCGVEVPKRQSTRVV